MTENQGSAVSSGGRLKAILPWVLFALTAIAFIIYAVTAGSGVGAGNVGDEAVAVVDGDVITANELYESMTRQVGPQMVDQLIIRKLVENKSEAENITVTDEDLNKQIEQIKSSFPSEDVFNQQLELSGLTLQDLKNELVTEVQLNKLLEPRIEVTDEQISAYFEENKASFNTQEQIRASHILVETREEAEEIAAQLKEGADFADLAKEHSKDPSAAQGGDLGFFGKGRMVAPFEEAAFALEVGETSNIVETEFGFHIIKLTEKQAATTATLEDKKEEIRETLFEQKKSEMAGPFIEELRNEAKIENYFENQKA